MRNVSTVFITLGTSLLLSYASTCLSQTPATNVTPAQTGAPKIQFDKTTHNFGRVSAGVVVKADFIFTNTGDATLEITGVNAHCGCTTAGEWDKKVEPGKTGKIPLQVSTANFNGQVTKTAAISCNDTNQPSITLQITGTVWKPIDVNPNMVSFTFPAGHVTNQTRSVRIVNNQEEAVTLSDVQSGNPAFLAELKTIEAGKVFELVVTSVPESITTTVSSAITLKTSSTNVPVISVNAMAIVQPPAPPPQPATPPAPVPPSTSAVPNLPTLTEPIAPVVYAQMTSGVSTRCVVRSDRPGLSRVLVEAGVLLVIGVAVALGANYFSPRGLKLARDYFPKSSASATVPVVTTNTAPLPADNAVGVPPAIVARLHQKGLQPLGHTRVAQLFHDPQYTRAIIFVDARDAAHYQAGHIPGAYQFDYYRKEEYLMSVVPACLAATNVVVYCNGGECEDSEFTTITLNQAGVPLNMLFIYAGGFPEWATNGLPVETGNRNSGQLKPAKP